MSSLPGTRQAGLFRLPGIPSDQGIGLLVSYKDDQGADHLIPLIAHFIDINYTNEDFFYKGGSEVQTISQIINELDENTRKQYMLHLDLKYLAAYGDGKFLTLNDFTGNVGNHITAYPAGDGFLHFNGNFPYQLGIEGAHNFYFQEASPSVWPWEDNK